MQIFDAHHHFWDLCHCHYPWLMAKGVKRFFGDPAPIQRNYLVEDLINDAAEFELVGSTHIQVGVAEEDAVKETVWLQGLGNLPSAIVAFEDLSSADLARQLDAHGEANRLRGFRQIIGRHPSEDQQTKSGDLLHNPAFEAGLKELSKRQLSFDLQLIAGQYDDAITLLDRVEGLRVAVCHFGSPWDQSKDAFDSWKKAMTRLAALPGVHLKFSGFGMFKPEWTVSDIEPYVTAGLELFGAERCMAGSNFPVDKLYGGYGRIWQALEVLLGPGDDLAQVTRTTAMTFYAVAD